MSQSEPRLPVCRRCGHEVCPGCVKWCDVVGEGCPCEENSECDFDPEEFAAWLADAFEVSQARAREAAEAGRGKP